MVKMCNLGIPDAGLRVVKFEQQDYSALNDYYNKYLESNSEINKEEKISEEQEVKKEVESLIFDAQKIIDDFKKTHDLVSIEEIKLEDEEVINFSQSSKEVDEVINTNIKKGESEEMAIKKELDNKEVVEEEVTTPVNFEEGTEAKTEPEKVEEEAKEPEKVEEEAKKEECLNNEEKPEEDKIEESCGKENCEKQVCEDNDPDDKDDADDDKDDKDDDDNQPVNQEKEVCENIDMSKADRKTFQARIATLENNLKAVKAELKVAAPFKALYEEACAKIAELEAYKEDVELDKLRVEKQNYADTCNFNALEDEDKEKVQEQIDDYKVSVYDFKAFMADVLKRYSRKQVYSNMEKIISYFSMDNEVKKADEIDLPSDKNQAERILDKYSDVL